jgi:hypothetical protein
VVFVADQHDDRPSGALGLLEGGGDAPGIDIALDEVIIEAERHQEALGVGRRGVGRDAVAGPAAIADHHHHRNIQAQEPAADRIAGFHHAGVLDQDHRLAPAGEQPGGDRAGMAFTADPDEAQGRLGLHQEVEPIGLAVGQPDDVGDAVLLHLRQHGLGAEGNGCFGGLGHGGVSTRVSGIVRSRRSDRQPARHPARLRHAF